MKNMTYIVNILFLVLRSKSNIERELFQNSKYFKTLCNS